MLVVHACRQVARVRFEIPQDSRDHGQAKNQRESQGYRAHVVSMKLPLGYEKPFRLKLS